MTFAPVDDLYRGRPESVELRSETGDGSGSYMVGHGSVFDAWYEIDSWFEGRFLERVVAGSFRKTIKENRATIVSQFDHGYDIMIGDSPLGPIEELHEDERGVFYGVPLLDTDYNRDRILPLLSGRTIDGRTLGSLLGSSFKFRVTKEEWVDPKAGTAHNPDKLPERTIREVRLFELGPVPFAANPAAESGVRSLCDHYIARRLAREGRAERAARSLAPDLFDGAAPGTPSSTPVEPPHVHSSGSTARDLRAYLALIGR